MYTAKCLFASAIVALLLLAIVSADEAIKATAILFRHGERTPASQFPNLPCSMCDELGVGQLTNSGSREMYENGLMLRLKYHHLLPKSGFFRLNNMRIMSSVPERTVMSLQSFMAGFFPPPVLNLNLPILWQPFHFDIDYEGRIVYLNYDYAACPVFVGQAYSFMMNPPPELAAWLAADKQAISDFAVLLGSPINNLQDILMVSDALKIQIGLDKNMPKWATDAFDKTFRKYGILVKTMSHATPTMIKIRGGPMVTEMVNNMVAVANKAPGAKNLLIYSAHDVTVASLAYALGVDDQIPEPISYSDTIMVDLVSRGSGEMSVEVVYMDNTSVIPRAFYLNVPGCGKSCTLTTFRNAVRGMMVEDFDKLCGLA